MQAAALLFLLAHVASCFVIPIKLAQVNLTEQAEVLTFRDNIWTTNVIIGTPGKMFNVLVDTTSAVLYIPDVSTGRGNSFDGSTSSSFESTNGLFTANGYYGSTSGTIGIDQIILGGTHNASITVANATFGLSTRLPSRLPSDVDGVLGLAFSELAPFGTTPVFETAIQQNDVSTGIFVLWLEDQYATSDNGTHGVIYYGNNDYLHCKVDQRHVYPLSSAIYFQFTVPSITSTVNGSATYTFKKNTQTIVDSTASYIGAPAEVVVNIMEQLDIEKGTHLPAVVPCDTRIDLAFNFQMNTEHVTELNLILKRPDGKCILALIESNTSHFGSQSFELGIPFLRGRCTYFDVGQHKIGFSDPITHGSEQNK